MARSREDFYVQALVYLLCDDFKPLGPLFVALLVSFVDEMLDVLFSLD